MQNQKKGIIAAIVICIVCGGYYFGVHIPKQKEIARAASLIEEFNKVERARVARLAEAARLAEELNKVGDKGYFKGQISFVVDSAFGGLLSRKAYYEVKYVSVVEKEFGESYKVIIKSASIIEPSSKTVGYIRYLSHAKSTVQNKVGDTRVIDKNDFVFY